MFKGSIPALITPFKNGEIDWAAFDKFVEWQIDQGSHALVPCGTTGECPTLSHEEHETVVERCVKVSGGRVPIIAGAGSNSTREAIRLTQHAQSAGADAVLSIVPYYNKPMQEGMYAHFKGIHDESDIPIILYNLPGRCVVDMSVETVARLNELPRVVGIKDATGDLERPVSTRREVGADFCQLSGCDESAVAFLAQGGRGCISVVANVAPKLSAQMHNAWAANDLDEVARIRDLLAPLASALFCESSPAPAKYAVSVLGLCTDQVRRPIVPLSENGRRIVDAAMVHAGLV